APPLPCETHPVPRPSITLVGKPYGKGPHSTSSVVRTIRRNSSSPARRWVSTDDVEACARVRPQVRPAYLVERQEGVEGSERAADALGNVGQLGHEYSRPLL
ncbi:unnamed protein product, partial [Ascophyllum nodosum]